MADLTKDEGVAPQFPADVWRDKHYGLYRPGMGLTRTATLGEAVKLASKWPGSSVMARDVVIHASAWREVDVADLTKDEAREKLTNILGMHYGYRTEQPFVISAMRAALDTVLAERPEVLAAAKGGWVEHEVMSNSVYEQPCTLIVLPPSEADGEGKQ